MSYYFMHTKFHQNPSSGSGKDVENVKSLRTPDAGLTDGALKILSEQINIKPCTCIWSMNQQEPEFKTILRLYAVIVQCIDF